MCSHALHRVNAARGCQLTSHPPPGCYYLGFQALLGPGAQGSVRSILSHLRRRRRWRLLAAEWTLRRRLREGSCSQGKATFHSGANPFMWQHQADCPSPPAFPRTFFLGKCISLVIPVVCISTAPQITVRVEVWAVERSDLLRRWWLGFLSLV